jgi:cystathionine beta-synthase
MHSTLFDLFRYNNIDNPMAHYEGTAVEMYNQCGGKIDMFVCGAGTGIYL